jgi:RNA polymerase sigma-70 factor (ECF subfamily)
VALDEKAGHSCLAVGDRQDCPSSEDFWSEIGPATSLPKPDRERTALERTDAQLACDAGHGDAQAFGILVERYRSELIGYLAGLLHRREDAEELAQETFLRAWQKAPSLRDPATVGGWLYRIAHNLAMSHARKPQPVPLGDEPLERLSADNEDDRRLALLAAVGRLSQPHREVIGRKYFGRTSVEQIAVQLGIPTGTVRSRLARAYGELRELLADELK